MSAILPTLKLDSDATLARHFLPYQVHWIHAEEPIHALGKQAFAFAEKSVRIGWTYADAFKNVRKRLLHKKRDYLFATKDWPSALEYMNQVYEFAELFNLTGTIVSRGEEPLQVPRFGPDGAKTSFTDEIKIGTIKFDTGSRIIAFSSNPYAMAVHGGDVGLDEFAKHPNAKALWQTAQGRVALGHDAAVWSSHDGEDTLFNEFAQQARAGKGPWNLYYHITLPDALDRGLLDLINRSRSAPISREQFIADCQARAGSEEIFQQSYMCNPLGATAASIVEWSAIERCRADYQIERIHLEDLDVRQHFGQCEPSNHESRQRQIYAFIHKSFPNLFSSSSSKKIRLGFDVAASGQGNLAAFYLDEDKSPELWLRALLTCRTDDWHFLGCVLFCFLEELPSIRGAGDESGLGQQICWEAANQFGTRFLKVNFASKKQELGFALMNQLASGEKRIPRSEADIAADFFALRKFHTGTRWTFSEGRNSLNPASHCDIAWAAALASYAHANEQEEPWIMVG
ncbi:MAG TPA: terminase family protein [Candidatus Acidoferrum sp.]|jgi:phage FluMu gp28-like protein|nr:terminase family protein [Candidatus Acidoferrum sp.]